MTNSNSSESAFWMIGNRCFMNADQQCSSAILSKNNSFVNNQTHNFNSLSSFTIVFRDIHALAEQLTTSYLSQYLGRLVLTSATGGLYSRLLALCCVLCWQKIICRFRANSFIKCKQQILAPLIPHLANPSIRFIPINSSSGVTDSSD